MIDWLIRWFRDDQKALWAEEPGCAFSEHWRRSKGPGDSKIERSSQLGDVGEIFGSASKDLSSICDSQLFDGPAQELDALL
jgi:hypothetical protein